MTSWLTFSHIHKTLDSSSNNGSATLDLDETLEQAVLDMKEFGEMLHGALDGDDELSDEYQAGGEQQLPCGEDRLPQSDSLYEGCRVTILQAYLMVFQFVLKHHLSAKAFSELLLLLSALLPIGSQLPKSVYRLKHFFMKVLPGFKVVEHQYCNNCHSPIETGGTCSNMLCTCNKVSHFISIPLGPQLKTMMEGNYTGEKVS